MPRGLIVYFSQGGTTAQVAERIAAGLRAGQNQGAQVEIDLLNLRDAQPPQPGGYDLLGIGSPAYYFQPPYSVMDYVDSLPELVGLPGFVFVLHGTHRGDTGNFLRRALTRKGVREVGYFHCHGADLALGYLREGILFSPDYPTVEDLDEAKEFGRQVASRLMDQVPARLGRDPGPALVYRLERLLANRTLARTLYRRGFRVERSKCTACGQCATGCPTGNITYDGEGRPAWGRSCLLCLFCEKDCPEEAITSPSSWPLVRFISRYNVRRALKDSTLAHARVKHSKGNTVRL